MMRVGFAQRIDDRCFGCAVNFGNEIVLLLARNFQSVNVNTGPSDQSTSTAGRFYSGVEHRVHEIPRQKREFYGITSIERRCRTD